MNPMQIVQTMQLNPDPSIIDLGVGQPQLSLLPLQSLRQAGEKLFDEGHEVFELKA